MYFVYRQRFLPGFSLLTFGHPDAIPKLVFGFEYDRRSFGRHFHQESIRVSFEEFVVSAADRVLVELARPQARDEGFPDARTAQRPHLVLRTVPAIEIADYADPTRIGRPNCERDAAFAFVSEAVGAELFIDAFV